MAMPFLDRQEELGRLLRAAAADGSVCVYGRRRLGKSRLLRELLAQQPAVYYVGDDREAPLQRRDLAREIARLLPGFDAVDYPDWSSLLARWWREAPDRLPLLLDEFPALVTASPELPSLLRKHLDQRSRAIVLCGSSQRMMHGLVLDATAPLYGRSREILRIEPLQAKWIQPALGLRSAPEAVEHYAVWGGVPRYWELAREYPDRRSALAELVLDPLGTLHREPDRLLLDDLQDRARSASILALIGRGCHRTSEIASRLGQPATALSRALARLLDLGFARREVPFGTPERGARRTLYRLGDPFLSFWYRFVEPERSRLAAGQISAVSAEVDRQWPRHLGEAWEQLARDSVARFAVVGERWRPAGRWWGGSIDGVPMELDIVAEHRDSRRRVLVGEAKLTASAREAADTLDALASRAAKCPPLRGRPVTCALWVLRAKGRLADPRVLRAEDVLG